MFTFTLQFLTSCGQWSGGVGDVCKCLVNSWNRVNHQLNIQELSYYLAEIT